MSAVSHVPRRKRNRNRKNKSGLPPVGQISTTPGFSVSNRVLQPFPPRLRTTEVYADNIAINLAAGIMQDYQFRLNSTFDPDFIGAGHQPTGRDTLATIYNRYRVLGARWRATLVNSDNTEILWAVIPTNSSTGLVTTDSDLMEQPRCVWDVLRTSPDRSVIEGSINLHQLTGVSSTEYGVDDRFQALSSTNPTEVLQLHNCFRSIAVAPNVCFIMAIEYDVEWFDPIPLAQS
jgi:hypothetical protein